MRGESQRVARHHAGNSDRGSGHLRVVGVAYYGHRGVDYRCQPVLGVGQRAAGRHHRLVLRRGDGQQWARLVRAGLRARTVGVRVRHRPVQRARARRRVHRRVLTRRTEGDRGQRCLVLRQRRRAAQAQDARGAHVAAADAILRAEVQRVAAREARADAHHRRHDLRVINVAHRDAGEQHRCSAVFYIGCCAGTGQGRCIIGRRDGDGTGARVAQGRTHHIRVRIGHLPGDGAACARDGRVVRGRVELNRLQRRGVVGQRRRARQRQHVRRRIPGPADAVLRRQTQRVTAGVAGADGHRRPGHLRVVGVRGHRHRRINHRRRRILRVGQGLTAATHHRRIVDGRQVDGLGRRSRRRTRRIRVRIRQTVGQRATGLGVVAGRIIGTV